MLNIIILTLVLTRILSFTLILTQILDLNPKPILALNPNPNPSGEAIYPMHPLSSNPVKVHKLLYYDAYSFVENRDADGPVFFDFLLFRNGGLRKKDNSLRFIRLSLQQDDEHAIKMIMLT